LSGQGDLFGGEPGAGERIELPGADLYLDLAPDLGLPAQELFERLLRDIDWREESITLYGKTFLQPRLLAWYGDPQARYRYSRRVYRPLPWFPLLAELCERMAAQCDAPFNSVLANLYRDGRDSMGLHADDEPELGPRPVIASLSLGAERIFHLRHRHDRSMPPLRLPLPGGSLLIMAGDTQRNWKHEIRKTRRPCGLRINLTFRYICSS